MILKKSEVSVAVSGPTKTASSSQTPAHCRASTTPNAVSTRTWSRRGATRRRTTPGTWTSGRTTRKQGGARSAKTGLSTKTGGTKQTRPCLSRKKKSHSTSVLTKTTETVTARNNVRTRKNVKKKMDLSTRTTTHWISTIYPSLGSQLRNRTMMRLNYQEYIINIHLHYFRN